MSSELLRNEPGEEIAPPFWRVVDKPLSRATVAEQLEQKFQEGKQHGLADAISVARQDADAQLQPVLQRLAHSIQQLGEARDQVRNETADELVRLSLEIASRVLHREIAADPDAIHGLLKAAFEKAQSREITRVMVHPSQEAAVRRFLDQTNSTAAIEILADPRLDRGGILLETPHGQLDASVETQLSEIERGLAGRVHD